MKELSLGYRYLRFISVLLCLLALSACAEFNSGWHRYPTRYNDPYSQADFDELLAFGDNMAKISPSARAKVCRSLLKRQTSSGHTGTQLRLMVGRLLSDACGDISRILYEVGSIPPGSLRDARTQKLVAIHTEALKRMHSGPRRVVYTERKQKATQPSVSGSKASDGSKNSETRLLREKLEAIRSMEKELDQSVDNP
jgi:hypothetical protein